MLPLVNDLVPKCMQSKVAFYDYTLTHARPFTSNDGDTYQLIVWIALSLKEKENDENDLEWVIMLIARSEKFSKKNIFTHYFQKYFIKTLCMHS